MRILHVGKYYAPQRGGMETVLRHMCEGLLERGHDVTAIVAGAGLRGREEPLGAAGGRLVRAGTVATVSAQPLCPGLPGLLRRELRRAPPDLLHLHVPHPAACAAVLGALRGQARPPVLAVWYHADITRQRLGRRLVAPLLARCLGAAAGVAVSTAALRDRSPWLAPHRGRVRVIPFGIEADEWAGVAGPRDGPFLFVGRLVHYKGLGTLVTALGRVPEARLLVVGEGPLRQALERRARREGLAARARFAGDLDPPALREAMGAARALVLPSDGEGETFGVVQLEAMAAGLPVISTRLPTGVAEVNVDGVTGRIVPPADPGALADALAELLARPERGQAWGEAGRARVRERYARGAMLTALEAWYRELLAARE